LINKKFLVLNPNYVAMKTKTLLIKLLISQLFISLFFVACVENENNILQTESIISTVYPEPESTINSELANNQNSYPQNEDSSSNFDYYPEIVNIPTPNKDTGIVTGRILYSSTQEPYLASALFLGKYIHPKEEIEGIPQMISINTEVSPKAIQAQDGTFVFTNVNPGDYGLFFWTPMGFIPVKESADSIDENIYIVITPGELIDLGTIRIE
jgi:hypothetical protein